MVIVRNNFYRSIDLEIVDSIEKKKPVGRESAIRGIRAGMTKMKCLDLGRIGKLLAGFDNNAPSVLIT